MKSLFLTLLIDGVNYNSSIKKLSSHRKRADTHMNPTIVGEIRKNIVEWLMGTCRYCIWMGKCSLYEVYIAWWQGCTARVPAGTGKR